MLDEIIYRFKVYEATCNNNLWFQKRDERKKWQKIMRILFIRCAKTNAYFIFTYIYILEFNWNQTQCGILNPQWGSETYNYIHTSTLSSKEELILTQSDYFGFVFVCFSFFFVVVLFSVFVTFIDSYRNVCERAAISMHRIFWRQRAENWNWNIT